METPRTRAVSPILCALLVALMAGPAAPIRAATVDSLAGTVQDPLGQALDGVEILLVRAATEGSVPTAVTHSDGAGRFAFAGLIPGRYRVAALKHGYRTYVGQIDTLARDTIELILRPTTPLDPTRLPREPSWALRLPRRGMLHETEATPASVRDDERTGRLRLDEAWSMEIEQLFSLPASAAERQPDDTEIQPSQTRVKLASALGERGSILVEGRQEQLGGAGPKEAPDTSASQSGSSLSLDLAYQTSPDARLAVSAFYRQTDYGLSTTAPQAPAPLQQEQQSWAYDARWSKQIDARRRLAVALDYRGTSLVSPRREFPLAPLVGADPMRELSNQAVGARGSYTSALSDRHDLQVAVRTQLLRRPTFTLTTPQLQPGAQDPSAWLLQADAQDTWSVAAPFSLIYGMAYKQALMTRDASLLVPRLGGSVSARGWQLRALVSYHTVTGPDTLPTTGDWRAFRPTAPLGYEAEVEMPVARDVRLRGAVRFTPFQVDSFGYLHGSDDLDDHPLYLTDGNSAVQEHRLSVVEERGSARTYLELTDGRAEGSVAPLLPFEGPLPIGTGQQVRYRNGRLGVRLPTWGTDFRVDYLWVEAAGAEPLRDGADSIQESVEVHLRQDLPGQPIPGDWRVLLALRLGKVYSGELEAWSPYEGTDSVAALNRRISAGVSVLF